jgi:hypothetical protein
VQNLDFNYNTEDSTAQFSKSLLTEDLLEPTKIHILY